MGMAGKRPPEAPHQGAVAVAELGGLAEPLSTRVGMQGEAAAGFAERVALGAQPPVEIGPAAGAGQIVCEEGPQGTEELLIRPVGRFRSVALAPDFGGERVADHAANGFVPLPGEPSCGLIKRLGQPQGENLLPPARAFCALKVNRRLHGAENAKFP